MYLAAGASAVWVIHPESRSVAVYNQHGTRDFHIGQKLALPPSLASATIVLNDIFGSE